MFLRDLLSIHLAVTTKRCITIFPQISAESRAIWNQVAEGVRRVFNRLSTLFPRSSSYLEEITSDQVIDMLFDWNKGRDPELDKDNSPARSIVSSAPTVSNNTNLGVGPASIQTGLAPLAPNAPLASQQSATQQPLMQNLAMRPAPSLIRTNMHNQRVMMNVNQPSNNPVLQNALGARSVYVFVKDF